MTYIHTKRHKDTQPHTNRDTQFQNGFAQLFVRLSSITVFDTYTYTVRLFGFIFISFFAGDKSNMIVLDVGLGPLISNLLCGEYT